MSKGTQSRDMDQLAAEQKEYAKGVKQVTSNYDKDPFDRKTTAAYYEERLRRLEAAWSLFEKIDEEIRNLPSPPINHPYFATGCYETTAELYEKYVEHFTEKIMQLKKDADSQTSEEPLISMANDEQQNQLTNTSTTKEDAKGAMPKPLIADYLPESAKPLSEMTRIMRRQRVIIQSLYRLFATLENLDPNQHPESFFELKVKTIQHYWFQVEEQNSIIWELVEDPTTVGYDTKGYIQLEDIVHRHLLELSAIIEKQGHAPLPSTQASASNTAIASLPKITLPRFDGDYAKWRQFFDLFSQMVHNQTLSNCQKMWYLKMNLVGEAEKLVRHFTLSDENYSTAWKILQDRYENKRLLVAALINKLLNQSSYAAETSSATSIKTMHDTTQECILGLENLGIPTNNWDPLLLHILLKKVDKTTHQLYEQSLAKPKEIQSLKEFLAFLEIRFQSLEALGHKGKGPDDHNKRQSTAKTLTSTISANQRCVACSDNHQLFHCGRFLRMSPSCRLSLLRKYNLCINCLKPGHSVSTCTLRGCTRCAKRHNTLVHIEQTQMTEPPKVFNKSADHQLRPNVQEFIPSPSVNIGISDQPLALTAHKNKEKLDHVLLSTARVKLVSDSGKEIECRAILDSGSQINLITTKIVKRLGVSPTQESLHIQGIGSGRQHSQKRISATLNSRINGFSTRLEAFVLTHIISNQPSRTMDTSSWKIPQNIALADPAFDQPDRIDLLLGAEFYLQILSIGQISLGPNLPTLQNTVFGWIVAGKISGTTAAVATCGVCTDSEVDLDKAIERFWKIEESEEIPRKNFTLSEKQCEAHFNQTFQRDDTGRFIVRLPFAGDPSTLGQSRDIALRRFNALEKRLARNEDLRKQYIDFMDEYIRLGHMEEINSRQISLQHYFLPHHCVIKPDSSTTKLRVVFDASTKTSTNISLNDILHKGPTIQNDLFTTLLRFRLPRFVFTADIQKMYRQVRVHEEDRKYHSIFWRSDPNQALKCYQLCTVTYGTSAAPYLAMKCLQRLAQIEATKYPIGSEILQTGFYVDDVMTGANSLATTLEMQTQLIAVLKEAGFKLRKWCANHPRLLQNIPLGDQEIQLNFTDEKDLSVKTLGLTWMPKTDKFCVRSNWESTNKITKRIVASEIARLFDPLGILAPIIVTAKIFLQELWMLKLDWDAALPIERYTKWTRFRDSLKTLNNIQFSRHVFSTEAPRSIQLHGFADASEKAYGAVIYMRSINSEGRIIVNLLCAKSRVAPTKKVSLPRLELCAAKLAAELMARVKVDLNFRETPSYLWTDSEITLAWINATSTSFQTFVANRIAAIQEASIPEQWRHVTSKENPADVLSRGIDPEKLKTCNLWFYGPPYLHGNECIWPPPYKKSAQCNEERKALAFPVTASMEDEDRSIHFIHKINHKNSFRKLQRVVGYILRFIKRSKGLGDKLMKGRSLTAKEMDDSLFLIVGKMQENEFKEDIHHLQRYNEVNKTSSLATLSPFLDDRGILRVGGRLEASILSYDAKHPMLLPYAHELTKFLMVDIHRENYHVGPQGLLSKTRQRFWPIKGKTLARAVVQHCVKCARSKPQLLTQIMGNLPPLRVQPARPFINSGVDFCGPLWVHYKIRGKRPHKAYVAVFCCFATKAVHLEVVSDLSTEAFIGALKRFIGRRGHCRNLFCDNATNFVGAKNQLAELHDEIYSDPAQEKITSFCSNKNLDFHFIPPRAPHFGGLWEAAVKSAKHLLQRSISSASLTYEELETAIIEIEAILNSRPLTAMSSDPNDLTALTPGHFLVGEPLTTPVDAQAKPTNANLLRHWKAVSHLKQQFWKRWSVEYLHELQHRLKWKQASQDVKPGTIVVIKEDNAPVMKWPLGRIVEVHKGSDGRVRVADVRTSTNVLRRAIHKLAPLPCEEEHITEFLADQEEQIKQPSPKRHSIDHNAEENSTTTNQSPRKRVRSSLGSSIVTLLLACFVLPVIKGDPVEVTQFNTQLGLHFENIGTINLITTEWKLIVYYDLQPYWMELRTLQNGTTALQHLCNQLIITNKGSCLQLVHQFEHILEELNTDNELISQQHLLDRQKRGAINVIGNIANALFGLLDSQYAEEMSRTIKSVQENEQHLLGLLKNQTSVIDSTINIIKHDQATTEEKFKALDAQIRQIIGRINNEDEQGQQTKIQHLFSSLAIQMSLVSSNLQRFQSAIIEVLTDTRHGKINPLLLSGKQLRQEIMRIRNNLPPNFRLPINQENVLELYHIMTAKAGIVNDHVIFQIMLPLINGENFDLFRVIPIPICINNSFIAIELYSPYLAVTPHRNEYYPLKEQDLYSCIALEGSRHLCNQLHPIYHKGANISACEIELLNNNPVLPQCKLTEVQEQPIWIQLANTNDWIFALRFKTLINVVCDGEVFPIVLNNSGLLKIKPNCVIKEDYVTIHGHQIYSSNSKTSYTKLGLFYENIAPEQRPIKLADSPRYQGEVGSLEDLQKQLKSLNLSVLPHQTYMDAPHHIGVSYLALSLIIVIAVYLGWTSRTRYCNSRVTKPMPQPRSPNRVVQI